MGRLDNKAGRFSANFETGEINGAIRGWQEEFGDLVLWYRFWDEQSETSDIWTEASGSGRIYHPPEEVPVIHATHVEGGQEGRDQGYYYNDDLYITASFSQLTKIGFTELDLQTYSYTRDRVVYDYRVFRVLKISVTGQIQRKDVMISIEGSQVRPDEMLNDPQFDAFVHPRFG